ncbi:Death ligand signal enhancer [Plakobranchus ocellatus]|uniref:Death ligand signal enhancer n=1 Tax=Plakobranchus ocellatus TaxID=259542 RepID=A0AAV3Y6F8_9GAST|nr:Death ligand signal enhancer [Plakobranchus ocellatus]
MWRLWSNISRAFRTHVYNPKPSAGVIVEDEQDAGERYEKLGLSLHPHEHVNNDLNRSHGQRDNSYSDDACGARGQRNNAEGEDLGGWWKTSHHSFWQHLHGPHSLFETITLGPIFVGESKRDRWRQKNSLLYRILFALPSCETSTARKTVLSTESKDCFDYCVRTKQLAIKDDVGAAIDEQINISKSETLESAVEDFQRSCREYTACKESVLGLQAVKEGDMSAAVDHLQQSCFMGNLSACFNLGLCYETGSGVPQDEAKAAFYYQKAARGGHKMALYNLGLMCLRQPFEESRAEAREGDVAQRATCLNRQMGLDFLEEAARLGLPEAQLSLGIYHLDECHEPFRAFSCFKAAADQNDSEAQYLLAMCYEQGVGVEVNECLAASLYSLAAQAGHDLALYNLGVFNEEGLGGLPKNEGAAVEMYQKAAELGNCQAKERLGELSGQSKAVSLQSGSEQHGTVHTVNESCEEFMLSGEKGGTEQNISALTHDSSFDDPYVALLSPSISLTSTITIPKQPLASQCSSSGYCLDRKPKIYPKADTPAATTKDDSILDKFSLFLESSPLAMDMEQKPHNFRLDTNSMGFSPHFISLSSLGSVEEEDTYRSIVPGMHKSNTFSEFSMIESKDCFDYCVRTKQLAIKDDVGAAIDEQINISKSETLESAVEDFQRSCREYTACKESVLGLQAVKEGDMSAAVDHLQQSCFMGNLSACFNLGLCYETGSGVPQDEAKAAFYYQKAARGGHKMALYNLGLMCLRQPVEESRAGAREGDVTQRGTCLNQQMGLDFLEEAARLGLPEAQLSLGIYHLEECHEPFRAFSCFKAAADQNVSLPKNEGAAVEMYQKAAELGNCHAKARLGELSGQSKAASLQSGSEQHDTVHTVNEPCGEEGGTEQNISALTHDSSFEDPYVPLHSPSVSLFSTITIPKQPLETQCSSSSYCLDRKPKIYSKTDTPAATTKDDSILDKFSLFLESSPLAMDMEQKPHNFRLDTNSMGFSPHSTSLSSLGSVEEEDTYRSIAPGMHKSNTFSEFSMIGI